MVCEYLSTRVSYSPSSYQHGRVKVKSSEVEEEAKKKEKAEEVRLYREVTSRIYEKVCVTSMSELIEGELIEGVSC